MAPVETPITSCDTKDHYGVIIIGAGMSGLAASIQLQRKLGYTDVLIYEKSNEIGGTWSANTYPGAGSDVPIAFYSYSFCPARDVKSQWAGQEEVMRYLHHVQKLYKVRNIAFETMVNAADWSDEKGVWTVDITNVQTGTRSTKTCNVLVSAVGALSEPNIPDFPGRESFQGEVFHSARWDHSVSLKGKAVVMVGNGCSAAQIVPEIIQEVGTLTQVARSRQSVIRRLPAPDGYVWNKMLKWIPGLVYVQRYLLYWVLESFFLMSDIEKGEKMRATVLADTKKYIREVAPEKYWEVLEPDFELSAKRRVFDGGYLKTLNDPKMDLILGDTVSSMTPTGVVTKNGKEIPADVVVLCTGFKVQDFFYPLKITNNQGVTLLERLKATNAKAFRSTCVSDFPNLFTLMGVNSATGHSSVIFTSEAQITMMIKLITPILAKLAKTPSITPAPSVVVTKEAEEVYYQSVRQEMKKKVWEQNGGVSWYVDQGSPTLFDLLPPEENTEKNLDVLINAIQSNPAPTSQDGSSFAFLMEDNNSGGPHTVTAAGISNLLAASQHLLSPDSGSASQPAQTGDIPVWVRSPNEGLSSDPTNLSNQFPSIQSSFDPSFPSSLLEVHSSRGVASSGGVNGLSERQRGKLPAQRNGEGQREQVGIEERRARIKKAIEENVANLSEGLVNVNPTGITTVLCLHSSVAQKSYGTEHRLLVPPPMVRVQGPMDMLVSKPRLKMSLVSEQGRLMSENGQLRDMRMKTYFRQLHVTGSAKAKSLTLQLGLYPPPPPSNSAPPLDITATPEGGNDDYGPSFAEFESAEITIMAKPSKATARSRNTTSCILAGSTIALHNRINGQNVRTKYMTIEDREFTSRTSEWTAFSIHVLRRPEDTVPGLPPTLASSSVPNGSNTITYGSEILLTDLTTGVSSDPLIVRQVDKKSVLLNATGPISQMQKLALAKVSPDGKDLYLSVNIQTSEYDEEHLSRSAKRRRKDEEPTGDGTSRVRNAKPLLIYQPLLGVVRADENGTEMAHVIDDFMSWTILGIESFSYSFFHAYASSVPTLPPHAITPFPTISSPPDYDRSTHTLVLSVTHFRDDTADAELALPLEVWLGPIGPLKIEVLSRGPLTSEAVINVHGNNDAPSDAGSPNLISVTLPSYDEILRAATSATPPTPMLSKPADSVLEQLLSPTSDDPSAFVPRPPISTSISADASNDFLERSFAALADSMNVDSSPAAPSAPPPFLPTPTSADPLPQPRSQTQRPTEEPVIPIVPLRPASLPLIVVRPSDGVGYMTGRWVVAELEEVEGGSKGTQWRIRII